MLTKQIALIRNLRVQKLYYAGVVVGGNGVKIYPFSNELKEELSICCFWVGWYSYGLYLLNEINLTGHEDEELLHRVEKNKKFFFNKCDISVIKNISSPFFFSFSITTCKRNDLFIETMNSFLENFQDKHLIGYWLCVDDNSSEEDRKAMVKLFPFFRFIFKSEKDKGHPISMDVITKIITTPYLIHIEDDRVLVNKTHHLSAIIDIFETDENIGQICFNHNYTESVEDDIKGGDLCKSRNNLFFYKHVYHQLKKDQVEYTQKVKGRTCSYYPHFSLSPSVIRTSIFKHVQFLNEPSFEFNFGLRFLKANYYTAFLPGFHFAHKGRLTSEILDINKFNAYDMSDLDQFWATTPVDIKEGGMSNFLSTCQTLQTSDYSGCVLVEKIDAMTKWKIRRVFTVLAFKNEYPDLILFVKNFANTECEIHTATQEDLNDFTGIFISKSFVQNQSWEIDLKNLNILSVKPGLPQNSSSLEQP